MAGGRPAFRHLSRDSSGRKALLRGLVTQLIRHEHIQTTYAKAKEAQRMAEKLITLAKRNNEPCRRHAQAILYTPDQLMPKLYNEIRTRYADRVGGYTRVLRTEPKNPDDQAESAIIELVDGPRDSRFMMTALAVARDQMLHKKSHPRTEQNREKVTRSRQNGDDEFRKAVALFKRMDFEERAKGDI